MTLQAVKERGHVGASIPEAGAGQSKGGELRAPQRLEQCLWLRIRGQKAAGVVPLDAQLAKRRAS